VSHIIIPDGKEYRRKNAFDQDKEATDERAQKIASSEHDAGILAPDAALPKNQQHEYSGDSAAKQKNFDQKVYLFPESFNALRRELEDNWPNLFNEFNPEIGMSIGYAMAFNSEVFIGAMNGALDMAEQYDSGNVDAICKAFLNALRAKRGVSKLQ
jgi:hypothetical protein